MIIETFMRLPVYNYGKRVVKRYEEGAYAVTSRYQLRTQTASGYGYRPEDGTIIYYNNIVADS